MTALDALQAVYAKGERCRECGYCYYTSVTERLSGRATERHDVRCCGILDSHQDKNQYNRIDPEDCPGVEDELRSEDAPR